MININFGTNSTNTNIIFNSEGNYNFMYENSYSMKVYGTNWNGNVELPNGITEVTFEGCSSFNGKVVIPDSVVQCSNMFSRCTKYNQEVYIPNSVVYAYKMFSECSSFNQNVVLPNNLSSSYLMLNGCKNFSKPIVIEVDNLNATYMLSGCTRYNESTVINGNNIKVYNMLTGCINFNSQIEFYGNNINAAYMLNGCINYNRETYISSSVNNAAYILNTINNFNSKVYINAYDSSYVLNNCNNFNSELTIGNHVRYMNNALRACRKYNLITTIPDSVTSTIGMFDFCTSLNSLVYSTNSLNTAYMFNNCTALNADLGSTCDFSKSLNTAFMFSSCSLLNKSFTFSFSNSLNTACMFNQCNNLDVSSVICNSNFSNSKNSANMFKNIGFIKAGQGNDIDFRNSLNTSYMFYAASLNINNINLYFNSTTNITYMLYSLNWQKSNIRNCNFYFGDNLIINTYSIHMYDSNCTNCNFYFGNNTNSNSSMAIGYAHSCEFGQNASLSGGSFININNLKIGDNSYIQSAGGISLSYVKNVILGENCRGNCSSTSSYNLFLGNNANQFIINGFNTVYIGNDCNLYNYNSNNVYINNNFNSRTLLRELYFPSNDYMRSNLFLYGSARFNYLLNCYTLLFNKDKDFNIYCYNSDTYNNLKGLSNSKILINTSLFNNVSDGQCVTRKSITGGHQIILNAGSSSYNGRIYINIYQNY